MSPQILVNIALVYSTLGEHDTAVETFDAAIAIEQDLAIAHFQRGVSNFLLLRYQDAYKDFEETLLHLGANRAVFVVVSLRGGDGDLLKHSMQRLPIPWSQIHTLCGRRAL